MLHEAGVERELKGNPAGEARSIPRLISEPSPGFWQLPFRSKLHHFLEPVETCIILSHTIIIQIQKHFKVEAIVAWIYMEKHPGFF